LLHVPAEVLAAPDRDAIVDAEQRGVWRFLRWLGADAALADDLAQETFLRFLRQPAAAIDAAAVGAWLRTTARHLFVSARARARPGVPLTDAVVLEATWQRLARGGDGSDYLAALARCLDELAPRARTAIDLHYRHRAELAAIAPLLGLTTDAVKNLLLRARQRLGGCIRTRLETDDDL
jgi:RNA polymerase sigma-70 factor (ECF subfamily)